MEQTESELLALRREKLAALEKLGVAPFGAAFETSGDIARVREKFAEGASFRIAGRISAHRDMGKSHFVDLKDASGRMQIYLQAKELGPEAMEVFKLLDLGDFIGVECTCFTTKTREPTLKGHKLELLAKSLRPLPEKWHSLQHIAAAFSQRCLDLITNEQLRRVNSSSPLRIEHRDAEGTVTRTINLTQPWRRARYHDLVREAAGADWFEISGERRRERAKDLGVEILPQLADFEVTQHVFEKLVEEKTFDPLFVTHCPKELVPLAKQNRQQPELADVYELIINGAEISPGYTELNDPIVQRQRLLEQAGEETQKLDEDFLLALEHGMPPAGGFGLGIDRLTMLLTGAESIRDVILFPLLKPKRVT